MKIWRLSLRSAALRVRRLLDAAAINRSQLERAVLDIEVGRQAGAKAVEHVPAVRGILQHDVSGDHVHPARDRLNVEIMDVRHASELDDE